MQVTYIFILYLFLVLKYTTWPEYHSYNTIYHQRSRARSSFLATIPMIAIDYASVCEAKLIMMLMMNIRRFGTLSAIELLHKSKTAALLKPRASLHLKTRGLKLYVAA